MSLKGHKESRPEGGEIRDTRTGDPSFPRTGDPFFPSMGDEPYPSTDDGPFPGGGEVHDPPAPEYK